MKCDISNLSLRTFLKENNYPIYTSPNSTEESESDSSSLSSRLLRKAPCPDELLVPTLSPSASAINLSEEDLREKNLLAPELRMESRED